jgi:hypothetical protein
MISRQRSKMYQDSKNTVSCDQSGHEYNEAGITLTGSRLSCRGHIFASYSRNSLLCIQTLYNSIHNQSAPSKPNSLMSA